MSRSASEPLRALSEEERKELHRVSRAPSEARIRFQRAVALLAVDEGKSLSEAARIAGWKSHDPVTKVTRRFNRMGLAALDDRPRSGHPRTYGVLRKVGFSRKLSERLTAGKTPRELGRSRSYSAPCVPLLMDCLP